MNVQVKSVKPKHQKQYKYQQLLFSTKINKQLFIFLLREMKPWWLALLLLVSLWDSKQAQAQSIVPAADGTGTIVAPNGNQINIGGGQISPDNANLFHSFTQFGLNPEQIANFLASPGIQNILGRIVGGEPSVINGKIQVTGSNANLFLMNPSGFIFGYNASLNVPGAFTATTANGIGFGSNWFSASGTNNYAALVGTPSAFSFSMSQPGAIFNSGNLAVVNGQNLTLLAGTVANTGTLSAPGGNIIVSAVPGEKLVRLSQPGSPLSLEIQPLTASATQAENWSLPILSLPQLLTSGGGGNANKLIINSEGKVALSGSGITVENGDVVAGNITAKTATVSANRNLTGVESQIQTTGDLNLLAMNRVQIRDSVANPFIAKAGGDLSIQGNQNIDILALNHPLPAFESGRNLSLISDGIISGDAHFNSGGNFSILNLSGQPGNFVSLYDPIVNVAGDYTSGAYSGAALKVEAGGNITFSGGITITGADTTITGSYAEGTDEFFLQNLPSLILRSPSGTINVNGNIDTGVSFYGGPVILSAAGDISSGNINTSSAISNGGLININSSGGAITTGDLTSTGNSQGGAITLNAARDITTNRISTVTDGNDRKADVNITSSNGSVNVNGSDSITNSIVGKSITINAPGTVRIAGALNARSDGTEKAGNVTIGNTIVPSSISVGIISTRNAGEAGGGGGDINITTTGVFTATGAFSGNTGLPDSPTQANSLSIASESFFGSGGNINIKADGGITTAAGIASNSRINQNILNPSSVVSRGGAISLSGKFITTGDINSSGFLAGDVNLNSAGDITFDSINTQSINSRGGNVNITANGIVRGTSVIPVEQGSTIPANTTIFTRGTTAGTVKIQHNGGVNNVPFIVGDSTTNGTAGAIDAGANSRITANSFPVLPNGGNASNTPDGISIISVNSPPTLTIKPQLNGLQQDKPFTFTYADLSPSIQDADKDQTSLQIVAITAGTLRKNGVIVVPNTASSILVPGDTLEYTPPTGFSGNISPLSITAGDGVSFSAPQTIAFNVKPTPTPKVEPTLPLLDQTNAIQQPSLLTVTPPAPILNVNQPARLDPAIENIEDKFASQFESYFASGVHPQVRERRRVSLYEMRDILRQIEKAAGVKPAIIYISFIPSGTNEKVLENPQDSDELELLLVTGNSEVIRKTIPTAKRREVLEIAEEFYGTVETPNNENYRQPAQELYQLIIAPLKQELDKKGINNLLFVADEGLRSLPFAALYDGKQFLVENYSVGFTPALSLTDTRYFDIRNSQVLAMGASKFKKLKPLPAVPEELSIVAQEIWKGKFFVNQNFTLKNLKSLRQRQPFGIVHLATHGNFEKGEPQNSFIQFWDTQLNVAQMRDLGFNNPPVELLVLSACRTALGDRNAELGFGGMAYNVGVKTAVASLWQVSDAGTLGFMTEFYKNLKSYPIKAEALRQAQLAMLRGQVILDNGLLRTTLRGVNLPADSPDAKLRQNLKHPFYWSAFTMIGNPW